MANAEYEFDQGFTNSVSPVTSSSISFTNLGVDFTWSVSSDVDAGLGHFPGGADGVFDGVVFATSATGDAEFVLQATSPGQSIFSRTNSTLALSDGHIAFQVVQGKWKVVFVATSSGTNFTTTVGTSALTTPTGTSFVASFNASFNPTGRFTEIRFTTSASNSAGKLIAIDELNTTMSCFCEGTRIATPEGSTPVETLAEGDMVLTADGQKTCVKWVGKQFVDTRLRASALANPICISRGALGDGLPKRDLWLSRDHAIAIDGILFDAGVLVNGQTIYRVPEMPSAGFTYYHVETDAHELILAEGAAAESYIDYRTEGQFDNAADRDARIVEEMPVPRISSARLVPAEIRRRLQPLIAAE